MVPVVMTRDQVRQFDQIAIERFGMNSIVLMENAARMATDVLCEHSQATSVAILCGGGNNGGDGIVMARHLHLRGWKPKVILLAKTENLSQDSAANWRILTQTRIPWIDGTETPGAVIEQHLADVSWIVDGVVGTGSKPPLRQPASSWIRSANLASARRFAIDVPSGLDCDSERTEGDVFQADITVTFVALKPVMTTNTGKHWCGQIRIADIGAPPETFDYLEGGPDSREIKDSC